MEGETEPTTYFVHQVK